MRKSILLGLILMLALPVTAFAVGQARMTGKVVDPTGKPIKDATITVVATEVRTFKEVHKVKSDGTFALAVVDGTIKYEFTVAAPGFSEYKEVIKMALVPEKNERTFTLGAPTATSQLVTTAVVDPATAAYNEGAKIANEGNLDGAIAKMEEAIKLKPELSAAYMALAKLFARKNDYAKSIAAAEKALALVGDDDDMYSVLAEAYAKSGNKEKAAEYKAKAPQNAPDLYNQAVNFLNAGKDAEAVPLLTKATELDASFSDAWFQLGMAYVRLAKNPEAKAALQKYLDLAPNGNDAAMAKEVIKYLN
ncbi:MAG: tetratricopeptide repeat protein [Acidobacteria bacterium]|nr:tetratricopeptide repeat protein [Acidobacteriota bacterium]